MHTSLAMGTLPTARDFTGLARTPAAYLSCASHLDKR